MKIAVSSKGKDLDSLIDPRFGRCPYFLVVETGDMSFEAFENRSLSLGSGAGIQSAQFISSKGVDAVITGNCGPNAVETLAVAGIKVFLGNTGFVRDALQQFKNGTLSSTKMVRTPEYGGFSGRTNLGRGKGMGGQRGGGRGRRMGGQRGLGDARNRR